MRYSLAWPPFIASDAVWRIAPVAPNRPETHPAFSSGATLRGVKVAR